MKKLFTFILTALLLFGVQSVKAGKVYFVNSNDWGDVHCYAWTGETSNGSWPEGVEMTAVTDLTYNGKQVYVYELDGDATYDNCIFLDYTETYRGYNDHKTYTASWGSTNDGKMFLMNGYTYDCSCSDNARKMGDWWDTYSIKWGSDDPVVMIDGTTRGKITKSLAAATDYNFIIYKNGTALGTAAITHNNSSSVALSGSAANSTIKTTSPASYVFQINTSTDALTVSYPTEYIKGSFKVNNEGWVANEIIWNAEGTVGSVEVFVPYNTSAYQFGALCAGNWYKSSTAITSETTGFVAMDPSTANADFTASAAGMYTFNLKWDKATQKPQIQVVYPTGGVAP